MAVSSAAIWSPVVCADVSPDWFCDSSGEDSCKTARITEMCIRDRFFPLQLRIGTLFLEGRNLECNVINLPEAERHLLIAARYALAEQKVTENAIEYAGKAYYRAAQAAYLIGADCQRCGNVERVKECLERALAHLVKAAKYWPAFRGVLFLRAKCYALLENKQEALECIRILSDTDRTFHSAAMEDGDFATIRQNVDGVFRLAIDRPGPNASKARDVIAHARIILNWAKTSKPQSEANERVIAVSYTHLQPRSKAIFPTPAKRPPRPPPIRCPPSNRRS